MRITKRDITILRDLALSHVLARDQLLQLGYFGSISRLNFRMRELVGLGLARRLSSPFFGQSIYVAARKAADVVGERISTLIEGRTAAPRFLCHALSVANVRIALQGKSKGIWRFEQQLWRKVQTNQGVLEVRPDGLFNASQPIFIEVDLGHASAPRFREKLNSYDSLAKSGQCQALYGFSQFRVLAVTTGQLRARHLRRLQPTEAEFDFMVKTFEEVGATPITPWS